MVATEMTGRQGISVDDSVSGLVKLINEVKEGDSGKFYHKDGSILPW